MQNLIWMTLELRFWTGTVYAFAWITKVPETNEEIFDHIRGIHPVYEAFVNILEDTEN